MVGSVFTMVMEELGGMGARVELETREGPWTLEDVLADLVARGEWDEAVEVLRGVVKRGGYVGKASDGGLRVGNYSVGLTRQGEAYIASRANTICYGDDAVAERLVKIVKAMNG